MKESMGMANPEIINRIMKKKLDDLQNQA